MLMAFLGVVVINNPLEHLSAEEAAKDTFTRMDYIIGSAIALSGAVAAGGVSVVMRFMNKGIHYSISPFWYASGCTMFSPIFHSILVDNSITYEGRITPRYDWWSIFLISIPCVGSCFGQILCSRAY
jgi:drug/metabolite transporter (DMT)-like permease